MILIVIHYMGPYEKTVILPFGAHKEFDTWVDDDTHLLQWIYTMDTLFIIWGTLFYSKKYSK